MSEDDKTKENSQLKMDMKIRPDVAAAPEIESIEILELLGMGGMSLVYKARQKELDRIVAVKVLSKMAVRDEDGLKRFQKEARLTSTLDHPNIVKTISFGVSKDEQPYLVMEYLEGLSLAEDLKQNGRLKLQKFKDVFLPALSALNQAHQAGLVHRDIKPGNIMICRNETGVETVKLVDFGIAKVFGEGEGEGETENLTKSGAVLGSPTYMSPEQCQGMPVDGRSDLYSMACVMYETLSGEPPFSGVSLLEVMQKHSAEPPPTVSELSRKIDIRKELANVTLWGLAKDPAARPQTASEFARKLNEVLERITLDKVPRLKKSVAASVRTLTRKPLTIAILLLLCLLIVYGAFLIKHRAQVQVQGTTAAAASFQRDEREYNRILARAERKFGTDDQKILPSLFALAGWYKEKGKYTEAVPVFKRILAIQQRVLGPDHIDVGHSLATLAFCYHSLGKYAEQEPLWKGALEIYQNKIGPNQPEVIHCLQSLADVYYARGKYADAIPLYKRSLEIREKALVPDYQRELLSSKIGAGTFLKKGSNHEELAESIERLGDCYDQQRNYAKAEPLFKRVLEIREFEFAPNDRLVAVSLECLGNCYDQQGKYAKAEPLLKRALEIRELDFSPNDFMVAVSLSELGRCYYTQGKYAEAEPLLKRAVTIVEKGPNRLQLATCLDCLGNCYDKQGKYTEAESLHKRSLEIREGIRTK